MKRKKLLVFILCGVCLVAILLMGCVPKNYTDELLIQVSNEYMEKANTWFENHPEYQASANTLVYDYSDITNLVSGNMIIDGESYACILNVDEDMLYTEKGYDLVAQYVEEYVADQMVYPYTSIRVNACCQYPIPCTEIRNMTLGPNPKEKETEYIESARRYPYLPIEYDEAQIKDWVISMLTAAHTNGLEDTNITIIVADYDNLTQTKGLYDIMKQNPGINRIAFKTDEKCEVYYTMYREEKNKITYIDTSGDDYISKKIRLK